MDHVDPLVGGEGDEPVREDPVVREPDPGDPLESHQGQLSCLFASPKLRLFIHCTCLSEHLKVLHACSVTSDKTKLSELSVFFPQCNMPGSKAFFKEKS